MQNKKAIIVILIQTIKSTKTFSFISIGKIVADIPNTNKILKIFDPNTLPKAISFSPFLAATKEVTSSGKEVPIATIVNPTNASDIPNCLAIKEELLTTQLPPKITPAKPITTKIILFQTGISFGKSSVSS